MPVSESSIEDRVCRIAKSRGWFVRKVTWIGQIGAPDRVFIRCGYVLWIEFKAPGMKPRPSQVAEHRKMTKAGARVFVVDSIDGGDRLLRAFEDD